MPSEPSQSRSGPPDEGRTSQYVGFRLDGQRYAFPIEQIQEIVLPQPVTPLPETAAYVLGVTNLRGTIIPVIDLRLLLSLSASADDASQRVVIVNVDGRTMGCVVDSVSQVIRLDERELQQPPSLGGSNPTYITGVVRAGDDVLMLLNVDELLTPEKLEHVHEAAAD